MSEAWYSVASMLFGYAAAAMLAVIVLLAARKMLADRGLWRRVRRGIPQAGAAGVDEAAQRGHVHERQIAREHEDRLPEFPECGPYPSERPEAGFRVGDGTDARQG